MGPQLLEEGSETAGNAADGRITLLVQEGPVVEWRSVQIATNHAEGERGHVSVAVALPVSLAVRDHVHRHVVDLMVLLEVDRRQFPVLKLGEVSLPLFALFNCPGATGLQVLGEEAAC